MTKETERELISIMNESGEIDIFDEVDLLDMETFDSIFGRGEGGR